MICNRAYNNLYSVEVVVKDFRVCVIPTSPPYKPFSYLSIIINISGNLGDLLIMQEGREVVKKKAFVPPPRFMNIDEARYLYLLLQ